MRLVGSTFRIWFAIGSEDSPHFGIWPKTSSYGVFPTAAFNWELICHLQTSLQ